MKIFLIGLFVPFLLFSQPKSISSISQKTSPDYAWITNLTEGEIDQDDNSAYRVIVTTSEIYNSVFFEKIAFGEEGCCAKVVSIRKLNIKEFASLFKLNGELSGFEFLSWMSPTGFTFKLHDRLFKLSNLSRNKVDIEEIK